MQMWHTGDYCTLQTSLLYAIIVQLPENCNYSDATKEQCYTPKDEEAEMGNRNIKNKKRGCWFGQSIFW